MKWLIIVLGSSSLLILLGVILAGNKPGLELSDNPRAVALCKEGTEDAHAFRLRAAVAKLGEALKLDPSLAEASIARAVAFGRLGERDNLTFEVNRADSLTALIVSEKRRLLAQLRLSSFHSSRFRSLRDSILDRVQADQPDNIHVLIALTEKAEKSGDEEWERSWRRVLESDPNYANSYNMLGYIELNRGNYDKAIEHMQKYAFLAPDLANPHDSLGEVYLTIGRYEEAEAEFRTSVTMQPDFYLSLINLGKTYLARGQLKTGLGILEKVRNQVTGSELEKRIDRLIIMTYIAADLESDLARVSARYIAHYPEDSMSGMYRAIRLAYMDRFDESTALMDSCLTAWRNEKSSYDEETVKRRIDAGKKQYDGFLADLRGNPAEAASSWQETLAKQDPSTPDRELIFLRYRMAASLREAGQSAKALKLADDLMRINPRMINVLILKTRCHLDLGQDDEARATLEQLQWSLSQADQDYPAHDTAVELEAQLNELAQAN